MKRSLGSLIALTLACTVAATIFGFGSEVFSWRSLYKDLGREELIQATRLFVYIALGVLLAFRGGWLGVLAAIVMATAATSAEWALYPFAYAWAAVDDPAGYAADGYVAYPYLPARNRAFAQCRLCHLTPIRFLRTYYPNPV